MIVLLNPHPLAFHLFETFTVHDPMNIAVTNQHPSRIDLPHHKWYHSSLEKTNEVTFSRKLGRKSYQPIVGLDHPPLRRNSHFRTEAHDLRFWHS